MPGFLVSPSSYLAPLLLVSFVPSAEQYARVLAWSAQHLPFSATLLTIHAPLRACDVQESAFSA